MPLACVCQQIIQIVQKTQNNLQNVLPKFPYKAPLPDFLFGSLSESHIKSWLLSLTVDMKDSLLFKMKFILVLF